MTRQTSADQDSDNQLSDAELEQVTGGSSGAVLLSSPLAAKARPISSWSGAPYVPVEDVEAY